MARKNTQLSISDKWSLEEQLGAALRELDNRNISQRETSFREEVLALMQQFEISVDTLLEWHQDNILNNKELKHSKLMASLKP